MEEMDDFGDLYADLEDHVSAQIDAIPNSSESMSKEAGSVGEECGSGPCGEIDGRLTVYSGKGLPALEAVVMNGITEISYCSDSDDDDLNIVLNEEDCPKFQASQGVSFGKGGMVMKGSDDEDEGDDLVIVSGTDRTNKDLKWVTDQLPPPADGLVQVSAKRHIGSQIAGLPSSARTSMSGRGNWDQLMVPCFGVTTSCNLGISAAVQNGVGFSLPRNRTIFDINIEAFEQKPWRHHGVDMTDYFNFGLDEESWKSYCNCLEHLRQQATVSVRSHFYESPRFNQPKGRAIQVEGGLGERIPSTDIRRPRHQDSDVVIQIPMESSLDDKTVSCKKSLEHAEQGHIDASLVNSTNKLNGRMLSLHHDGQRCGVITNPVDHEENPLRANACMLESGSASGDQVLYSSSSADLEIRSETSKDAFSLETVFRPIKKTPLRSNTRLQESFESDYHLSNDSRSNDTETEQEDRKVNSHDCNLSVGEPKHVNRKRLQSVAKLSAPKDEEPASALVYKKHQNDVDSWKVSCKTRESKSKYVTDVGGDFSSFREKKIVLSYKDRTHAAKHGSEKYCTKISHKKCDHGTHLKRNWFERDHLKQRQCYFYERYHDDRTMRGFAHKDCDQSNSEHKFFVTENDSCLWLANEKADVSRMRMETEYDGIISDHRYREGCLQEMRGKHIPHSYEEEIFDQKFVRHVSPTARELRSPERRNKYDRSSCSDLNRSGRCTDNDAKRLRHLDHRLLVSHTYREPSTTDERDWCDAGSPQNHLPISWRSSERFDNHRGLPNIREVSFKNIEHRIVPTSKDHRHSSYENDLDFGIDEYISEARDVYHDNIASNNKVRRHNWLTKPRLHLDNGVSFRHREQNGSSSPERSSVCERSSRHEKSHVNHHSICDRTFSGDCLLNNTRKKTVGEGSCGSDSGDHVGFVTEIFNRGRNELADIGCREALNIHLNGWKGKLPRRSEGVKGGSERHSAIGYNIDNGAKDSWYLKKVHKHEEVHPHSLKGEGSRNYPDRGEDSTSTHLEDHKKCSYDKHPFSQYDQGEGSRNYSTSLKADRGEDSKSTRLEDHNKSSYDKHPISQHDQDEEIEEGQLIEEPDEQDVVSIIMDQNSEKRVEKTFEAKNSSCNDKIVGRYDNNHILKTLAKMEKRKERFKEPIAPKQVPEKSLNTQLEVSVVADEVKQQRPARKRRWGGS